MNPVRLLPLLAAAAFGMFLAASPAARAEAAPHALRLLTYNVNYGNPDVAATLDAIEHADADVVLLQEVTSEWKHALLERLAARYPHRVFRVHPTRAAGGLAVLSRLPIEAEELLPCPERGWFPAERIILRTGFGKLQVLNVHLRPAIDRGSWIRGYVTTPPLRRREIEAYWRKMKYDLPTIVAGDFNEEPSGSAVAYLKRHGMARIPTAGPTTWHYTTRVPGRTADLLRLDIDHVLIDGTLAARDARVLDAGTSDHRPVVVTIVPGGRS
jgi:endonuclease/exonuclease/phosphatase (EEP) superfamily protein YafD